MGCIIEHAYSYCVTSAQLGVSFLVSLPWVQPWRLQAQAQAPSLPELLAQHPMSCVPVFSSPAPRPGAPATPIGGYSILSIPLMGHHVLYKLCDESGSGPGEGEGGVVYCVNWTLHEKICQLQAGLSRGREHILRESAAPRDVGQAVWDEVTRASVGLIRKALVSVPTPRTLQLKPVEVPPAHSLTSIY